MVRAFAVETHENWLEPTRYLKMEHVRKHQKGRSARSRKRSPSPDAHCSDALAPPLRPAALARSEL